MRWAALVAALAALAFSTALFLPGLNTAEKETGITIRRGMPFRAITEELRRAGSIKATWPLLVAARIVPDWHKIKPGRYRIPPGLSIAGLLDFLHAHPQDEVRITIPEGLDIEATARLLASGLDQAPERLLDTFRDSTFLHRHGIAAASAEGYLFPGTYNFAWASTSEEAASFLIGRFRFFFSQRLQALAAQRGLDETELLTLASIVESETPLDREKPLVASVYLNRLRRGMRLQADPTVRYALKAGARRLLYKDLEVDSPYNTYRHGGLPPGPICSPGEAALLAVLEPAETPYLYFVATGNGGHRFARTLKEHQANVRNYRRVRAARGTEKAEN